MDANDVMQLYGGRALKGRNVAPVTDECDLQRIAKICRKVGFKAAAASLDIRADLLRQYVVRAEKKGLI